MKSKPLAKDNYYRKLCIKEIFHIKKQTNLIRDEQDIKISVKFITVQFEDSSFR